MPQLKISNLNQQGQPIFEKCPNCGEEFSMYNINRHTIQCLKKRGSYKKIPFMWID